MELAPVDNTTVILRGVDLGGEFGFGFGLPTPPMRWIGYPHTFELLDFRLALFGGTALRSDYKGPFAWSTRSENGFARNKKRRLKSPTALRSQEK
jgi:hypothetical protein